MYNKNGLKHFMYYTTYNDHSYMQLPIDLRILIWDYSHIYPIIQCFICDKVLINFQSQINNSNNNENYSIVNGRTKCNNCYID
uniref:Uncharacterized protein n=1 Tax=viral metagenome TaxID=1070528 RepID=A0A6C0AXR2_9ZZZZ